MLTSIHPPNKDCPCLDVVPDVDPYMVSQTYLDLQQVILAEIGAMSAAPSEAEYECNLNSVSHFPCNVFRGVYGKYCSAVDKNTKADLTWIVDSYGNKIPPRKERVQARSSPPNPATWKDYRIDLGWSPDRYSDSDCIKGCTDAFDWLSNTPCKLELSTLF